MQINLSPQRRDDALTVSKSGEVLTINGDQFDFSSLPEGATIPAGNVPCEWIVGPVERISGEIHLTLILPHGSNPSAAVAFPEPIINPADGVIAVPFDPPAAEPEEVADVDA
ncbi:hypothetical protein D3C80_1788160 [compost metagenome]